nr:MAG TPA_asm: hypothetical protein [Caudoviricetes sp.]
MGYYIIIFIYIYILYIIIRYCIAYLLINSSLKNLWRGKRYIIYNIFKHNKSQTLPSFNTWLIWLVNCYFILFRCKRFHNNHPSMSSRDHRW